MNNFFEETNDFISRGDVVSFVWDNEELNGSIINVKEYNGKRLYDIKSSFDIYSEVPENMIIRKHS